MNGELRSFFSDLRQVAVNAEKHSRELKEVLQTPPPSQEDCAVSAELMLREMLKETKDLTVEAKMKMNEVKKEHNSFGQLLSAHKTLYQSNINKYHQLETYLQKYGYHPVNNKSKETSPPHENSHVMMSEDKENIDSTRQQSVVSEDEIIPATPVKVQAEENPEQQQKGGGTPKLENFGLSRTTLEMLARLDNDKSESVSTDTYNDDRTYCISNPTSYTAVTPVRQQTMDPGKATDTSTAAAASKWDKSGLSQASLAVLARLNENNADSSTKEDITFCLSNPPRAVTSTDTNTCNGQPPSESWKGPIPPGFVTPKQPKTAKYGGFVDQDIDSPVPPIFRTPGLKQIQKPTTHVEVALPPQARSAEQDIDSPIPPVFVTPGLKQIKKPTTNQQQPIQTQGRFQNVGMDSPVPPVFMTPGLKQIVKPEKLTVKDTQPTMESPATPQLQSQYPTKFLPMGQTETHTPSPVVFASKAINPEDLPDPESPQITSVIQYPLPQQPVLMSSTVGLVHKESPKTPVLNFEYNYHGNVDNQSIATPSSHHNQTIKTVQNTEKQQSQSRQRTAAPVTTNEFLALSEDLQRIIPCEQLNEIIFKINQVIGQNASGGYFMRKSELSYLELGPHTNAVLLVLVKLNRLQMERKNQRGEIVHFIN